MSVPIPRERIEQAILVNRGQRVMLSTDLADLYAVEPRVLVQAVKRSRDDFQLTSCSTDGAGIRRLEITDSDFKLGWSRESLSLRLYGPGCCHVVQRVARQAGDPAEKKT